MAVLVGFPLQDQLREPTEDGRPSENASYNCVATSTAAACRWLTGVWHSGDRLKDGVYGEAWRNAGTAERDYVGLVARLYAPKHVAIARRPAKNQADLIGVIRSAIKAGHPILISMPSAWRIPPRDPMHPGSSHCAAVYQIDETDAGYMTVMNPWRGWADRRPILSQYKGRRLVLAGWRDLLCYNEGWELSLEGQGERKTMGLPAGWHYDAAAHTVKIDGCANYFERGFADALGAGTLTLDADDWPLMQEEAVPSVELGNPSRGAGTIIVTRKGMLVWTAKDGNYRAWAGQELLAWMARAHDLDIRRAAAQAKLDAYGQVGDLAGKAVAAIRALSAALPAA